MHLSIWSVVILSVVFVSGEEKVEHGNEDLHAKTEHNVNGQHNEEYDHEAVIGSRKDHKEFDQLSPSESKRRLGILVDQMDKNKDGNIDKEELTDWIFNSFKNLDAEEASDYFNDQDKDEDMKVTFNEYVENYYGYNQDEMENWDEDKNDEIREMGKMIKEDQAKFTLADRDNDGALDKEEYNAFYHPWDHEHMHAFEIDRQLAESDENGDGLIDMKEYMGSEDIDDQESQILEMENFKAFDKNGDGQLDRDEIKDWVIPDNLETAIEEAEHLLGETDSDDNGILSKEEIINASETWVGSAATDYGVQINEKFHDPSEL